MADNKSIWKKTNAELTVAETLELAVITPIFVIGGMAALVTVAVAISAAQDKIQEIKKNRQNKKLKK